MMSGLSCSSSSTSTRARFHQLPAGRSGVERARKNLIKKIFLLFSLQFTFFPPPHSLFSVVCSFKLIKLDWNSPFIRSSYFVWRQHWQWGKVGARGGGEGEPWRVLCWWWWWKKKREEEEWVREWFGKNENYQVTRVSASLRQRKWENIYRGVGRAGAGEWESWFGMRGDEFLISFSEHSSSDSFTFSFSPPSPISLSLVIYKANFQFAAF